VVLPVTVDCVKSAQGTFEGPVLTTPAAADRWKRERNAWTRSLVYSVKAAADKLMSGGFTLAQVGGAQRPLGALPDCVPARSCS
jgi:hypothetical protein